MTARGRTFALAQLSQHQAGLYDGKEEDDGVIILTTSLEQFWKIHKRYVCICYNTNHSVFTLDAAAPELRLTLAALLFPPVTTNTVLT